MAKRSRATAEEECDVSDVSKPSPNAKIHGIITCISPMKKSKTCDFFDGEISDGKSSIRLFGFDSSVRKQLFLNRQSPVSISNCEVKNSRRGNQLEVCLGVWFLRKVGVACEHGHFLIFT